MKYIKNIIIGIICFTTISIPKVVNSIGILDKVKNTKLSFSTLDREFLLITNLLNYHKSKKFFIIKNESTLVHKFINAQKSELSQTPNLSLIFLQNEKEVLLQRIDRKTTKVVLDNEPFQIVIPQNIHKNTPVQICSWEDNSIFEDLKAEKSKELTRYFRSGTAGADPRYGSGTLYISNISHLHVNDDEFINIDNNLRSIYISKVINLLAPNRKKVTLYQLKEKLFSVVYIDKNRNNIIDNDEYEFLILEIN